MWNIDNNESIRYEVFLTHLSFLCVILYFPSLLQVTDSLKVGNESLKQINAMLDIEDIERILDETKEAAEKQEVNIAGATVYRIGNSYPKSHKLHALSVILLVLISHLITHVIQLITVSYIVCQLTFLHRRSVLC